MTAVVTCLFSFGGYSRPAQNARRFTRQIRAAGADLFAIELHDESRPAVMAGIPGWRCIGVPPAARLWQKEKLINSIVGSLDEKYQIIIVCDSDVYFSRSNWPQLTEASLSSSGCSQPWSIGKWTGEGGEVFLTKPSMASLFATSGNVSSQIGHAGFCWAFRRSFWSLGPGLFDTAIAGSGDIINAFGLFGRALPSNLISIIGEGQLGDYNLWLGRVIRWSNGAAPGVAGMDMYHEWHGHMSNRRYRGRQRFMHLFNRSHITDMGCFYQWSESAPVPLVNDMSLLFSQRAEDGGAVKRLAVSSEPVRSMSIVMTTHEAYLPMLDSVARSIDAQGVERRICVVDGDCQLPSRDGWEFVRSNARNPNASRNIGLARAMSDWVIFWDGDNIMPAGYAKRMSREAGIADQRVGFIYPNIKFISMDGGKQTGEIVVPEYDYWRLRDETFVDTSSIWRASAVLGAGGFSVRQPKFDDYELAIRLTRIGWLGAKSAVYTQITSHDRRRSVFGNRAVALWNAYTFGIVTLWGSAITPHSRAVAGSIREMEFPPRSVFYWAYDFAIHETGDFLRRLASEMMIEVRFIDSGRSWVDTGPGHGDFARHQIVAGLYAMVLPSVGEDMVMIIENDNIGPADGVMSLMSSITPWLPYYPSASGGAYRSRSNPSRVCASHASDRWRSWEYDFCVGKQLKCQMIGGGYTLWRNSEIRRCPPLRASLEPSLMGWDANLGRDISANGGFIALRGDVPVKHLCVEQ